VALFHSFANLFISSLIEDSWVLISASVFNLLQYHMTTSHGCLENFSVPSRMNESEKGK
jgi:hypothetical protein